MNIKQNKEKSIMQQEALALQIDLHIEELMAKKYVTPNDLSFRLGKKRTYIDKLDYGKLSLRQISDIFTALDSTLTVNTVDGLVFNSTITSKN